MHISPVATMPYATRVAREQHAYDEAGLRRQTYEAVLSHTEHLYREHRIALAGRILRGHAVATALEIGCKTWADFLGRNGVFPRELDCINISESEMALGRQRLGETALRPRFRLMDAHALDYPDRHFDLVFGTGILHHLDLERALAEIARVLKPDGIVLFGEPLDTNPVGRVVRALTPRARTADERALRKPELARIARTFACTFHFEQSSRSRPASSRAACAPRPTTRSPAPPTAPTSSCAPTSPPSPPTSARSSSRADHKRIEHGRLSRDPGTTLGQLTGA